MLEDKVDRAIVAQLQQDLPLVERPFAELASRIGISEDEFLKRMQQMDTDKVIRRFGATVKHHKMGISANVMCTWNVADEKAPAMGKIMAEFPQVSHCYQRPRFPEDGWVHNMYTMLHGKSYEEIDQVIAAISKRTGITEYMKLRTIKEYKKSNMIFYKECDIESW